MRGNHVFLSLNSNMDANRIENPKFTCKSALPLRMMVDVGVVVNDVLDVPTLKDTFTRLIKALPMLGGQYASEVSLHLSVLLYRALIGTRSGRANLYAAKEWTGIAGESRKFEDIFSCPASRGARSEHSP
jgi:hypothetical protein